MAITGSGTQADPFIVHNHDEFISLSGHSPVETNTLYIKFFDTPNQTINCNDYGSEFKWDTFSAYNNNYTAKTIDVDLNGCTIKNFLIADGKAMFNGHWDGANSRMHKLVVHDGSIRNMFMGSSSSRLCDGSYVEFHNVSFSINVGNEATSYLASNTEDRPDTVLFDNCAMYIAGGKLGNGIFDSVVFTDTDFEFQIVNQNSKPIFNGRGAGLTYTRMKLTDCRIQGKISGDAYTESYYGTIRFAICALNANNNYASGIAELVNSVIDVDFSDSNMSYIVYTTDGGVSVNTNVFCTSHVPGGYASPSAQNYMTHEQIRNGDYLNSHGFTVVEVVGG